MEQKKFRVAALIPLRGGSKSIPEKNIKIMAGKPLACWTVEAASLCPAIDEVFVATDSEKIRNTINSYNYQKVKVIERSPETCTDTASTESVILEFADKYPSFDYIVLIQATSPLLTADDLTKSFSKIFSSGADSLLSVVEQKRFIWQKKGPFVIPQNYDPMKRPRRQDFEGYFVENGAFYISSRKRIVESKCRITGNIACHVMPEESYYELDEEYDWNIIEAILKQRKFENKHRSI